MARHRSLTAVPLVVGALLILAFIRLGLWQLERSDEKARLFDAFEAGTQRTPISLQAYRHLERYTPVALRGRFQGPPVFLDNQTRAGRTGVHVLLPLETASEGPEVLVNLGWQAIGPRRELPDIEVPKGTQMVRGLLADPPPVGIRLGDALPADGPLRLTYLELPALAKQLNIELAPQILLATDSHPEFVREWRPATMPPERHGAYALQWFSLAAAVFIIMMIMLWRRQRT